MSAAPATDVPFLDPHDDAPIGLMAGWGAFPVYFAEKARAAGKRVVCVGLPYLADPVLKQLSWRYDSCAFVRINRMCKFFRNNGVKRLVMAGKVFKADILYKPWKLFTLWPDWRAVRAFYFGIRRDNKDDAMTLELIHEFARDGLEVASALDLCPELLMKPGVLTKRQPTARELKDIDFGWTLARKMGELDVGQSVAVKESSVLAVEAIEGTDKAILRAGELCRAGGFTVVKTAKPAQDMRFDVPAVGKLTVETIHKAGGKVLAIEANRTIVLDQAETVALADRLGITIVVVEG